MTRSLAVAAGVVVLACPSAASAASMTVSPQKRCYSSGETVNLLGSGFTPNASATVTRGGLAFEPLPTDSNGLFNGELGLSLERGRETRTYTATDDTDRSLTASVQFTVIVARVGLTPVNGAPGRRLTIRARGFATGRTLWAHVIHGRSKRNLKIGRLRGACGNLKTRKRLLPQNAAVGVHRVQFDTFRRYDGRKEKRPVRDRFKITVTRI